MTKLKHLLALTFVVLLWALPAQATEITEVTSPSGLKAWLVQDKTIPMIAVELSFKGGSVYDAPGKEGTARMTMALLDEGAGDLDSEAFQAKLADLSLQYNASASKDSLSLSFTTLSSRRDEAFQLMNLALSKPRFDAAPVERIRGQLKSILVGDLEDAQEVAFRTFFQTAFKGHPYGRPTMGTVESLAAIGQEDIKAFHARRLARDNVTIGVVGDISPDELTKQLDVLFAGVTAEAERKAFDEIPLQGTGSQLVVEKDIPQSAVVFGLPGIQRDDPDYYAAYVMNYVLGGGGFVSRLYNEVREKRGLAYSVYSYLYDFDHAALWVGGVGTRNERVGESLKVIREQIARMADSGVTAQELKDAKTYLLGSWPLKLDSNGKIARMLVAIQVHKLGKDYLSKRNDYMLAVRSEDIQKVAKRLMKKDKLLTVVVGKPVGL